MSRDDEVGVFEIVEEPASRRTARFASAVALACIVVGMFVAYMAGRPTAPPDLDRSLVEAGRKYAEAMDRSLAESLRDGALALEKGKDPVESQDIVRKSFAERRSSMFAKLVEPGLEEVLPSARIDEGPSKAERLRLARALRSVAKGVERP